MKRSIFIIMGAFFFNVCANDAKVQIDFLDELADKAIEKTTISLDGGTLDAISSLFANKDTNNSVQKNNKNIPEGIEGIYVRTFTFDSTKNTETEGYVKRILNQVKGSEWHRTIDITSKDETIVLCFRVDNKKATGMFLISSEPDQLTVVNIVGAIDADKFHKLGGSFGIPKIENR
jgi:hypothetical protein